MNFRRLLRLFPIEFSLFAFACLPSPTEANEFYGAWQLGSGIGETTITGDHNRSVKETTYTTGLTLDRENWLFIFDGSSASDNRFKDLRLIGAYGNRYIKLGGGFIGVQSSIPTEPGTVAGFYVAATERDTDVSATTIPLFMRITPYRSNKFAMHLDAYYGLYSQGSMTIPIKTLVPGRIATISTEPQKTGGTYGGTLSLLYQSDNDIGIRLAYSQMYGKMDARTAKIDGDLLGLLPSIQTPSVKFVNRSLFISIVLMTD